MILLVNRAQEILFATLPPLSPMLCDDADKAGVNHVGCGFGDKGIQRGNRTQQDQIHGDNYHDLIEMAVIVVS